MSAWLWGVPPLERTPLDTDAPLYQVLVHDADGYVAELATAQVQRVSDRMFPDVGEAEIVCPLSETNLSHFADTDGRPSVLYPWIVVRRDGVIIFRGYVADSDWEIRPDEGVVRFVATSLVGLFKRVTSGDAERVNWWDDSPNPISDHGVTHTVLPTGGVDGGESIVIDGPGYVSKVIDLPLSANDQVWHPSVWVFMPTGALVPFPLQCVRILDGGPATASDVFLSKVDEGERTTRGQWIKYVGDPVPIEGGSAVTSSQISMRFFCTDGAWTLAYSLPRLSRNDNTGVAEGGDAASVVSSLVLEACTKLGLPTTRKASPAGVTFDDGYRVVHSDHTEIMSAIGALSSLVEARYDAVVDRVRIAGRIGRLRRDLVLGSGWSAVQSVRVSGARVVKAFGILSEDHGDPITREEAVAVEVGAPVPVEAWETAPEGLPIRELGTFARSRLAARNQPAVVIDSVLPIPNGGRTSGDWITHRNLTVGDTVPGRIVEGPWDFATQQRIVGWDLQVVPVEVLSVQTADDTEVAA